ncbi:protein ABHD11 isoform X2 [Amborella trichopoda]|uniref:protein ABHD11 isoform X2 n=1 Tax=Amborella trichopoda TaxID=13333 RepID=UPI0009BE6C2F|nr:protein ABHD11 isoform X2 [Amborella trichopoda]|eukprot:XP_020519009.1 protein ABHD11 isoform X2 [Amborella trichopoda]
MAGTLNISVCGCEKNAGFVAEKLWFDSCECRGSRVCFRLCKDTSFNGKQLVLSRSTRTFHGVSRKSSPVCMTMVDERPPLGQNVKKHAGVLAYDLVQGALFRWSTVMDRAIPDPPTAVLLHGILGARKNWGSFARRLAQEFPTWQFLLVDLRCHGDSASIYKNAPHTVASAALDVLKLVAQLRLTPRVLVGHSFGGKVALSMVDQAAKPLPRPVRVWVLDATPGKVRAGGDGEDHPAELIAALSKMPKQVSSKRVVVEALVQEGFSKDVAQWVVTNLKPAGPPDSIPASFSWVFDLNGLTEMYKSYEETNLWKVVEDVPRGVHVNFLKAERSLHRWALKDIQRIHAAEELAIDEGGGVEMHVLEDAGHWHFLAIRCEQRTIGVC